MTDPPEQAEGQTLAASLIEAVGSGSLRASDWETFFGTYAGRLRRAAERHLRSMNRLSQEFANAAELVDDFVVAKVFDPVRGPALLGPSARGERPLEPRLLASLENYCIDLHRRRRRRATVSTDAAEPPAPTEAERTTREEIERRVGEQVGAIREVFAGSPARAPYREALLLQIRLDWARALVGLPLTSEAGGEVEVGLSHVVAMTGWTDEESGRQMNTDGHTLAHLWGQLAPGVASDPRTPVTGDRVAAILRVPRDRWDAWVSRGRRALAGHLAGRYARLFPHWRTSVPSPGDDT
jgi:DNA-directed RNA polymerase specialized sigma24 family protein